MPIHYIEGDLLENEHEVRAYAIESNTEGLMNTQVAVQFRTRYPRLFEGYRAHCLDETVTYEPGDIFIWEDRTGLIVYNVAIFKDPYLTLADRPILEQAIAELRRLVDEKGLESLAMPPIGAGMGALNWRFARKMLEEAFNNYQGDVYVYVKNKSPERDLEAIQTQIDETVKSQPRQRRDDRDNNDQSGQRRSRRGRRGRRQRSDDDSSNDKAADNRASTPKSDANSGSQQTGDQPRKSDDNSSEGESRRRSRRGRRGRGRRGGRSRNNNNNQNKQQDKSQSNQQNSPSTSD